MTDQTPGRIYIGTSGWSYEDWEGIVYPEGPARFDKLVHLSHYIDAVEVNTSFYHPVAPRMVESWLRRTAHLPDFLFCFKLHQRFTHRRDQPYARGELNESLAGVAVAHEAGKLGALLAQFPWSMRNTRESVQWLQRLADDLADYPLAVEVRHSSWHCDEFIEFLRDRKIAFCNIDQPALRHCLGPTQVVTAPFSYVRLHGRNAENWFRSNAQSHERYNYLYSENELQPWVERLLNLQRQTSRLFVFANNHFVGQATANAIQLRYMVLKEKVPVSPTMLEKYPQLQKLAAHRSLRPIPPLNRSRRIRPDAARKRFQQRNLFDL